MTEFRDCTSPQRLYELLDRPCHMDANYDDLMEAIIDKAAEYEVTREQLKF